MKELIQLLLDDVLLFHQDMVDKFHNAQGIRDITLLESAIYTPFQSVFGQDLYPTLPQQAARLCYGIIKNHPFVDGNKRTATHVMLTFLYVNGCQMSYDEMDLEELVVGIANGDVQYEAVVEWVQAHI